MTRATAHTASTEQQREYKRLNDLSESQLTTLCAACGWHGGTYWQVVDEIRRLKAIEAQASNTRHALGLAVDRIELNARNAFGTAIYDNRPLDEFGPDWKKEDPEEYSEWFLLRTVLNAKEMT
jgi:hypothetical protein